MNVNELLSRLEKESGLNSLEAGHFLLWFLTEIAENFRLQEKYTHRCKLLQHVQIGDATDAQMLAVMQLWKESKGKAARECINESQKIARKCRLEK